MSGISYDVWVAYYSSVNTQILYSEKIAFSTAPGCAGPLPAPTVIPPAVGTTCTKATITWPSFALAGTAFKYRFYYRITGSIGFSTVALNDTFINLSSLTLGSSYDFFYAAICASSGSTVSGVTTMYTNCATPKTNADNPSNGTVTINGITYHNIDFRDLVAATEAGIPIDGQVHDIKLENDKEMSLENNIKLFPNPATNFVTVEYLAIPNVEAKLKMTSIDGKIIKSTIMSTENAVIMTNSNKVRLTTKLDVNSNQAGVYMITVSQDGNQESKQLVVIK